MLLFFLLSFSSSSSSSAWRFPKLRAAIIGMPPPLSDVHIKYRQHRTNRVELVAMVFAVDVVREYYPVLHEDLQKAAGGVPKS